MSNIQLKLHGEDRHAPVWAELFSPDPLTIVVLNDVHIPFHDEDALRLATMIAKDADPQVVILNGDILDFYAISRFSKDPIRRLQLADEIQTARDVLHGLFASFPNAAWIYIEGNHEGRMRQFLRTKAHELAYLEELQIPHLLRLPEHNVTYLSHPDTVQPAYDYATPQVKVGKLFIAHGDTFRVSYNVIGVARSLFLRTFKNLLIGHWHRADKYAQVDYGGEEHSCFVNPCLCYQRPYWDTGRIWGQGLSIVNVAPDGFFRVEIVSFMNDRRRVLALVDGRHYAVPRAVRR